VGVRASVGEQAASPLGVPSLPCLDNHSTHFSFFNQSLAARELCKKLKPLAPWDNVESHSSFKILPALNIDFLAHADPRVRQAALEDLVVRASLARLCASYAQHMHDMRASAEVERKE
jgi:hypothetical protein